MRLLFCIFLAGFAIHGSTQKLAKSGDFEFDSFPGSSWNVDSTVYSIDKSVKYSGKSSLKYSNDKPEVYKLCTQKIPLKPGRSYKLSAWIQTINVQGPERGGASLALEWYTAKGEFLSGFYPLGYKGTNDWQHLEETSKPAPSNASYGELIAYCRPKCTGTAWFDDVKVEESAPRAWKVFIQQPAYKNQLTEGQLIKVKVSLFDWLELKECKIKAVFSSPDGITDTTYYSPTKFQDNYNFKQPAGFLNKPFRLTLQLMQNSKSIANYETVVVPKTMSTEITFTHGVMKLDSKTFAPLGLFDGQGWDPKTTPQRLKIFSEAGFNTVLPYGLLHSGLSGIQSYLDEASKNGMHVIVSLKDLYEGSRYEIKAVDEYKTPESIIHAVVSRFKNHPALLAWYVNDEYGSEMRGMLDRNYAWIINEDPLHPCYTVSNSPEELETFNSNCDVIGVDPYPCPGSPMSMVSDWTNAAIETCKPVWMVTQIFDKSVYFKGMDKYAPTYAEKLAMPALALIHRAKGIILYSYYDLERADGFEKQWSETKEAAKHLKAILTKVNEGVKASIDCGVSEAAAWEKDGALFVLVVNTQNIVVNTVIKGEGIWSFVNIPVMLKPMETKEFSFQKK